MSVESPQKVSKTNVCVWLLNQAVYENVVCISWLSLGMCNVCKDHPVGQRDKQAQVI